MKVEPLKRSIKKVKQCPIQEAIIEVRFATSVPEDAILGLLYKDLKSRYGEYENLPITQIPKIARDSSDGSFQYNPFYRFKTKDFIFQLGPQSFSLIATKEYVGWERFSTEFQEVLSLINRASLIDSIERIGLRYIDFFEQINIFKEIKLLLSHNDESLANGENYIKHSFPHDDFKVLVQISNQASVNREKDGSVVDIDISMQCFQQDPNESFVLKSIENAHQIEKNIFFNLVSQSFLEEKLEPEYAD